MTIGVFTESKFIAEEKITEIVGLHLKQEIKHYVRRENNIDVEMMDGTQVRWFKPNDSSRGYYVSVAHIHNRIPKDVVDRYILKICGKNPNCEIYYFDYV